MPRENTTNASRPREWEWNVGQQTRPEEPKPSTEDNTPYIRQIIKIQTVYGVQHEGKKRRKTNKKVIEKEGNMYKTHP